MQPLFLQCNFPKSENKIKYSNSLFFIGSCFTNNIGENLENLKFNINYNSTGIVFDTLSIAKHIDDFITNKKYTKNDLFLYNELYSSWYHHSDFSSTDKNQVVENLNTTIYQNHKFLKNSNFLFITLGTSFSYYHKYEKLNVANCHKVPQHNFEKQLLSIENQVEILQKCIHNLQAFNPNLQIVFTVSPVRHIRDGIIENNRSKSRLLEVVHTLIETNNKCSYFPAYEIVIDILRDYRFFDTDLVHPNNLAITYVFDVFKDIYFDKNTIEICEKIEEINTALNHKTKNDTTIAHQKFLQNFYKKTILLSQQMPQLNFNKELEYFKNY